MRLRSALLTLAVVAISAASWQPAPAARPDWWAQRRAQLAAIQTANELDRLHPLALALLTAVAAEARPASAAAPGPALWQTWCDLEDVIQNCPCDANDPLHCGGTSTKPSHLHLREFDAQLSEGIKAAFLKASPVKPSSGDVASPGSASRNQPPGHLSETAYFNPLMMHQLHQTKPPFPIPADWNDDSITAKARWLPFPWSDPCVLLPVWTGSAASDGSSDWTKQVIVRRTGPANGTCGTAAGLEEHRLDEFYHQPAEMQIPFQIDHPAKPDADAVLVGLHLGSKEIKNWFWVTAWWAPGNPGSGTLPGAWKNYQVDSAISTANPSHAGNDPPAATDPYPTLSGKPIFNPYIEGVLKNCGGCGARSDCISCHSQAAVVSAGVRTDVGNNRGLASVPADLYSLHFVWSADTPTVPVTSPVTSTAPKPKL